MSIIGVIKSNPIIQKELVKEFGGYIERNQITTAKEVYACLREEHRKDADAIIENRMEELLKSITTEMDDRPEFRNIVFPEKIDVRKLSYNVLGPREKLEILSASFVHHDLLVFRDLKTIG